MGRISQYKTLLKIAECGSISKAGEALGISSAAVSKQINALEKALSVQLLIRTTRKLSFTEIGQSYLEQCKRVLQEVDAADALISKVKQTPRGPLRILSHLYFSNHYIIPNLGEFCSLYPEVELQLEVNERIPNLEEEPLDLMIGTSISVSENCIQKQIAVTRYTICASPKYLKKHGTPKSLEDLETHQCICHSGRVPSNVLHLNKEQNFNVSPYMRINDAGSIVKLALANLGIIQLHDYMVREHIDKGELKEILIPFSRNHVPIYLSLPPRRFTPSSVRAFIDFISTKL